MSARLGQRALGSAAPRAASIRWSSFRRSHRVFMVAFFRLACAILRLIAKLCQFVVEGLHSSGLVKKIFPTAWRHIFSRPLYLLWQMNSDRSRCDAGKPGTGRRRRKAPSNYGFDPIRLRNVMANCLTEFSRVWAYNPFLGPLSHQQRFSRAEIATRRRVAPIFQEARNFCETISWSREI